MVLSHPKAALCLLRRGAEGQQGQRAAQEGQRAQQEGDLLGILIDCFAMAQGALPYT